MLSTEQIEFAASDELEGLSKAYMAGLLTPAAYRSAWAEATRERETALAEWQSVRELALTQLFT